MKERLTKEKFIELSSALVPGEIWARIEADREAVREETRVEVLKDHFKIQELIEIHNGAEWQLHAVTTTGPIERPTMGKFPKLGKLGIRRPPKKRAMTREQMAESLRVHQDRQGTALYLVLETDVLKHLCDFCGIPTEVDE